MLCPVCRFDNFEGEDTCTNCGADLSASDIPQPLADYHATILGEHLFALGVGEPIIVAPAMPVSEAIRTMHAAGVDCLLVCDEDRLVGIFTDRDAVVKAAGKKLDAFDVRDTLAIAIHKMAVGGFRHIPIMDGDRPLGVVAAADVFRHIAASLG